MQWVQDCAFDFLESADRLWQGIMKLSSSDSADALLIAETSTVFVDGPINGITAAMAPAAGSQAIIQTSSSLRKKDIFIGTSVTLISSPHLYAV